MPESTSSTQLKCKQLLPFFSFVNSSSSCCIVLRRYPVPQRAETCGLSEEYLGRWIKHRNIPRDSLVIATKVFSSIKLLSLFIILHFLTG